MSKIIRLLILVLLVGVVICSFYFYSIKYLPIKYTINMTPERINMTLMQPNINYILTVQEITDQGNQYIPMVLMQDLKSSKKIPECSVSTPANMMNTSLQVSMGGKILFNGMFPLRTLFSSAYKTKLFNMMTCIADSIEKSNQ